MHVFDVLFRIADPLDPTDLQKAMEDIKREAHQRHEGWIITNKNFTRLLSHTKRAIASIIAPLGPVVFPLTTEQLAMTPPFAQIILETINDMPQTAGLNLEQIFDRLEHPELTASSNNNLDSNLATSPEALPDILGYTPAEIKFILGIYRAAAEAGDIKKHVSKVPLQVISPYAQVPDSPVDLEQLKKKFKAIATTDQWITAHHDADHVTEKMLLRMLNPLVRRTILQQQ